eukprot:scaffold1160_cov157-Isochrysis_galbana.AAC.1
MMKACCAKGWARRAQREAAGKEACPMFVQSPASSQSFDKHSMDDPPARVYFGLDHRRGAALQVARPPHVAPVLGAEVVAGSRYRQQAQFRQVQWVQVGGWVGQTLTARKRARGGPDHIDVSARELPQPERKVEGDGFVLGGVEDHARHVSDAVLQRHL